LVSLWPRAQKDCSLISKGIIRYWRICALPSSGIKGGFDQDLLVWVRLRTALLQ
jgi:hypothetical protein